MEDFHPRHMNKGLKDFADFNGWALHALSHYVMSIYIYIYNTVLFTYSESLYTIELTNSNAKI